MTSTHCQPLIGQSIIKPTIQKHNGNLLCVSATRPTFLLQFSQTPWRKEIITTTTTIWHKDNQSVCLHHFQSNKDFLACFPTSHGKGFIYQAWPIVFSELARLTRTTRATFCNHTVAVPPRTTMVMAGTFFSPIAEYAIQHRTFFPRGGSGKQD